MTEVSTRATRYAYLHTFAELARAGLAQVGLGPVRIPASLRFMPIELPIDLWYREYTQNNDLHIKMTDRSVSVRMHIDAFHGDRPRNEIALDLVRTEIEGDLVRELPREADLDWRAARGGQNQVLAMTAAGGVGRGDPRPDADWVVATAGTLLSALRRHPIDDLRGAVDRLAC